ncbi:MAG: restriction endonuclease subunit S [Treponema sp.]|nr:restriction endonuclease subunit S [Treponema sp.]
MAKKVNLPEPIIPNDSWKVVKLGQYVKILNGYPFDSSRFTNSNENTYPLIRIRDVVRGYTETFTDEDCPDEYKIKKGEILIGMDGDFNISRWKSDFGLLNQRVCKISTVSKDLDEKFLFYYLPIPLKLINDATPSVTVKHLSSTSLQELHFPLPTLDEQQRIVNRIESMFAKLDEAKEKAQNVVDGFETRKAAILHKAFTGELTTKWRKENGVSDDSWKEKRFCEVADIKSNLVDIAEYRDFPHIAPDNIEKKTGILLEYHTVEEDKVTSGKHRFYAGQILYSKIRPYLSKVIIVDFDGVCSADMYPIEAKGNTRFLWYQMLSNEFLDKASNSGSRSVLPKINQKELSVIPMQICSLPEQVEIVRILDIIIEKENKAKQAAEAVLEQIDLLKKSILARAFRGEL